MPPSLLARQLPFLVPAFNSGALSVLPLVGGLAKRRKENIRKFLGDDSELFHAEFPRPVRVRGLHDGLGLLLDRVQALHVVRTEDGHQLRHLQKARAVLVEDSKDEVAFGLLVHALHKVEHAERGGLPVHEPRLLRVVKLEQREVLTRRLHLVELAESLEVDARLAHFQGQRDGHLHRVGHLGAAHRVVLHEGREHLPLLLARRELLGALRRVVGVSPHLLALVRDAGLAVVRPPRVWVRHQIVKLRVAHLAIPIAVHHVDHHVDLLVRDHLSHADQDMPKLVRADVTVFVEVDKPESGLDFAVLECPVPGRPPGGGLPVLAHTLRSDERVLVSPLLPQVLNALLFVVRVYARLVLRVFDPVGAVELEH
mmetsp:Transcript_48095/g.109265  ORF Transcript_48095/g.109265 Transcript_48095/m.109265 type:complete len:369 (-) Transcript_48095:1279-2385(-)